MNRREFLRTASAASVFAAPFQRLASAVPNGYRAVIQLTNPEVLVDARRDEVESALQRARRALGGQLDRAGDAVRHLAVQVRSLSPQATLDRGYAVVRTPDGTVIRDADQAAGPVRIRVARGEFDATVP